MFSNLFEDGCEAALGRPAKLLARGAVIHDQPGNIKGTWFGIRIDVMRTEALSAPFGQLSERYRVFPASPDVKNVITALRRLLELLGDQLCEITRMKSISDLTSCTIKADVFEWPLLQVAMNPERKDSLIWGSKLASAGDDAAAIDPDR